MDRFPDPVAEASRYYNSLKPVKPVLPTCDWCGDEFREDDDVYQVDGAEYCEYCLRKLYSVKAKKLIEYK